MSTTATALFTRGAQSRSTRNATSTTAQARGFSWRRFGLRGLGTVVAAVVIVRLLTSTPARQAR